MGSLMAGWDSHNLDPKLETRKRNRSLTKEEIAAYWKNKKEIEEEHLRALSDLPETTQTNKYHKELEKKCKKSSKVPLLARTVMKESLDETSLEQLIKENGWWTKSSWAFLNEPPLTEASSNKYASQFHIANLGSSKFNARNDGISA